MTSTQDPIDLEALRAKRAEAILHGFDADDADDERDEVAERLDEGLCAACGTPCPIGLCEDCAEAGAHVSGPSQPVDIDAVRSYPTVGPETVDALCDEVEQLRETHAKLRALYNKNVGSLVDQLDEAHEQLDAVTADRDRLQAAHDVTSTYLDQVISKFGLDEDHDVNAVLDDPEVAAAYDALDNLLREKWRQVRAQDATEGGTEGGTE